MARHGHHIIPLGTLLKVFGGLVALTVFTVFTSRLDLGALNVPLALAIALTKAGLVLTFFMALKYDNQVNTLVFSIGAVFVVVFLVFTLFDTAFRGQLTTNVDSMTIGERQRLEAAQQGGDAEAAAPVAAPDGGHGGVAAAPATAHAGPEGEAVFAAYLCNTCHSLDGTALVGPSLQGVGSRLTREQLVESVMEPDAVITEGYQAGLMSATMNGIGFQDKISSEEFEALIDYLAAQQGS